MVMTTPTKTKPISSITSTALDFMPQSSQSFPSPQTVTCCRPSFAQRIMAPKAAKTTFGRLKPFQSMSSHQLVCRTLREFQLFTGAIGIESSAFAHEQLHPVRNGEQLVIQQV